MVESILSKIADVEQYGNLFEACYRQAERIVGAQSEYSVRYSAEVGIKQIDAALNQIDVIVKGVSRQHAVTQIARLLFQAALQDGEDQDADTV